MKRFIDRMTELTEQPDMKPIGKGLKDKHGYVLTTSASEHVCPVFKHFFVKKLIIRNQICESALQYLH